MISCSLREASQVAIVVKNRRQCRKRKRWGLDPGSGRSPRGGNGTHSSVLAWRIPWTEEPGGPQSMGLQRVGQGWKAKRNGSVLGSCFACFLSCLTGTESYPRSPRRRKTPSHCTCTTAPPALPGT